MNKLSLFTSVKSVALTATLLLSATCFAQKPLIFKMEYQPERKYTMGLSMNMQMDMDLKGDSVKKNGAQGFPMKMLNNMLMEMDITAGKKQPNAKKFPLTIKYSKMDIKMNMNGNEMPAQPNPLNGMVIKGWGGGENLLEFDTIANKALGPGMNAAALSKMMNGMNQQIKFPNKAMNIGETFDQVLDMDLPIPGIPAKLTGQTTYKLVGINNGVADFDMVTTGAIDMKGTPDKPMTMKVTMQGTGKLKFSEKQHFFSNMNNDMTMHMEMLIQNNAMVADMKMGSVCNVVITPVK